MRKHVNGLLARGALWATVGIVAVLTVILLALQVLGVG